MKGGQGSPEDISLIIVYTLAKALAISPLEIYKMPSSLVIDLLSVHKVFSEFEQEELEKIQRQSNNKTFR